MYGSFISKYLSGICKLDHIIVLKARLETPLRPPCLSIPLRMSALGMTREIRDCRPQCGREPGHVPGLPGLDTPPSDVHGTQRDLAGGHGPFHEEWGQRGQKPCARRGGTGRPNQPLDAGRIGRVKGRPRRVRLPLFAPSFSWPAPCRGPTAHLKGVWDGGQGGQEGAETLGPSIPAAQHT
jgi:hypothetical protein